jgi:hypothetical protein
METLQQSQRANGLGAMIAQLATVFNDAYRHIKPLIDQPVIRQPYAMGTRTGLVIGAGVTGAAFVASDFQHSLEWLFEVHSIKPTQDAAHTFADWRLSILDQTFNYSWFKEGTALVAGIVDDNTGVYKPDFPWIVRPKGGALVLMADNLDTVNPITVNVEVRGCLLIPRV